MPNKRFFAKDPEIQWEKVMCPICGQPTGSKSKCYEMEPNEQSQSNPFVAMLPLFSLDCHYRKTNAWAATTNYPISDELLKKLSGIGGIENIIVASTYSLQIVIARLFNEEDIKKEITATYKTFIKEMQALEIDLLPIQPVKQIERINFPNGASFVAKTPEEQATIREIIDNFPDVKEG